MGNNPSSGKNQGHDGIQNADSMLDQFSLIGDSNKFEVRSLSHGGKLRIFQNKQKSIQREKNHSKQFVTLNIQNIFKQKSINELQSLKSHINYYKRRIQVTLSSQSNNQSIQRNIIPLFHFSIRNETTNTQIYPEPMQFLSLKPMEQNTTKFASCGFENIFRKGQQRQPSITNLKNQLYSFSFLHEFNYDSLEKEILFRADNKEYFREKQVWSIVYCCCKTAQKMISRGLKQPVLSPGAIFINEQCQIKVAEWEFVNYTILNQEQQVPFDSAQQGETIITNEMQLTIGRQRNNNDSDILTKYFWPPEGLVEMQNTLRLGQIDENQKLSEAKNSQVFCLGMTMLYLLTLKPYYKKTTYSQKQLKRLIEEAVQIRTNMNEPMSEEIINLLHEMLQWDPSERFRYKDIIEYIHHVFETNEEIFFQGESVSLQRKSSSSNIYMQSQCKTDRLQMASLVTQVSVQPNFQKAKNQNLSNNQILIRESDDLHAYESRKTILEDSGIIFQGLGDDLHPQLEDEYQQPLKKHTQYPSVQRNNLSSQQPDKEDFWNLSSLQFEENQQQVQNPDQDIDYVQDQLDQNEINRKFSQKSQFISNYKPENSNQKQQVQNQFIIHQYIPGNRVPYNMQTTHAPYSSDFQNKYQSRKSVLQSYLNSSYAQNKILNFHDQSAEKDMRKNIEIRPSTKQKDKNFEIQVAHQINTFSTIIKKTQSPRSVQNFHEDKENYMKSSFDQNEQIFTSPNILEMIRQFTKKQSQQTPNFQGIHLPGLEFTLEKNYPTSKKLQFEEKPFDSCFDQSSSKHAFNQTFQMSNESKPSLIKDSLVLEQFEKGRYEGAKKNGARNGFGTFYYKQGGKYSGYWYNNKMDGHGTLYYPDGRIAYEGQWQNDSLHGKGILHNQKPVQIFGNYDFSSFQECENNECWIYYDGWFENDEKSGFGQLMLSNDQKYVGEFMNDMVNGKGKFYKNDGTIIQGVWQNNILIQHYSKS